MLSIVAWTFFLTIGWYLWQAGVISRLVDQTQTEPAGAVQPNATSATQATPIVVSPANLMPSPGPDQTPNATPTLTPELANMPTPVTVVASDAPNQVTIVQAPCAMAEQPGRSSSDAIDRLD